MVQDRLRDRFQLHDASRRAGPVEGPRGSRAGTGRYVASSACSESMLDDGSCACQVEWAALDGVDEELFPTGTCTGGS